jgi:hypothetical protein
MGGMELNSRSFRRSVGAEAPAARREAFVVLIGVPGGGLTGARSRSQ